MADVGHFRSIIEESCTTLTANVIFHTRGIQVPVADLIVTGIEALRTERTLAVGAGCLLVTTLSLLLEPTTAKTDSGPSVPEVPRHADASSLAV